MTLTIKELTVDEELGDFITRELQAGHFASESEMVEVALREMMANAGAERLWRRMEESERQAERGETIPADAAFFERMRERVRKIATEARTNEQSSGNSERSSPSVKQKS